MQKWSEMLAETLKHLLPSPPCRLGRTEDLGRRRHEPPLRYCTLQVACSPVWPQSLSAPLRRWSRLEPHWAVRNTAGGPCNFRRQELVPICPKFNPKVGKLLPSPIFQVYRIYNLKKTLDFRKYFRNSRSTLLSGYPFRVPFPQKVNLRLPWKPPVPSGFVRPRNKCLTNSVGSNYSVRLTIRR